MDADIKAENVQLAFDEVQAQDEAKTREPTTSHRPLIDLTDCNGNAKRGSYYVGVPAGPGYALGRKYIATRTSDDWHITRLAAPSVKAQPEDVDLLRHYLNGPRKVLLVLIRMGGTSFTDAHLLDRAYTVIDGPDIHDGEAWRAWAVSESRKALAQHYNRRVPKGRYYAITLDTEAGYLQGWRGLWPLGRSGIEIDV